MNKFLLSFSFILVCTSLYAEDLIEEKDGVAQVVNLKPVNFDKLVETGADKFKISNSDIIINNFADWQNWSPSVIDFGPDLVNLEITDVDALSNGEFIKHISVSDNVKIHADNQNRLYNINFVQDAYGSIYVNIVRETNYEVVFNSDSRGAFLENIRLNKHNDKMILAMDKAKDMNEINSIMNSSYHFNPLILMNPVKTINRSLLNDMFIDKNDIGIGADFDYIFSNKLNDFGTNLYFNNKYNDLYFRIGINLNNFSYDDDLNEFTGFSYGLNLRAKQYLNNFWLDGMLGINRTSFNADSIYLNGNISSNPYGVSEYARFNIGYDYTKIDDVIIAPFLGMMVQHYDIISTNKTDVNLHSGLTGKYNFIIDGIKYEYEAILATDEKAKWNIGIKVGFLSVVDRAGAFIRFDAFRDEFDINYKFSLNAKMEF